MKIIQDHKKCISCGSCTAICPKYWKIGEDGKAEPVDFKKSGNKYEVEIKSVSCNKEAMDSCPVQCIMVKE